jgi:hypothetical protein
MYEMDMLINDLMGLEPDAPEPNEHHPAQSKAILTLDELMSNLERMF